MPNEPKYVQNLTASQKIIDAHIDTLRRDAERLHNQVEAGRDKQDRARDEWIAVVTQLRADLADCRREQALDRQQLADHLKRTDESDRRLWTLFGLAVAAILAFAGNLAITWVRR